MYRVTTTNKTWQLIKSWGTASISGFLKFVFEDDLYIVLRIDDIISIEKVK